MIEGLRSYPSSWIPFRPDACNLSNKCRSVQETFDRDSVLLHRLNRFSAGDTCTHDPDYERGSAKRSCHVIRCAFVLYYIIALNELCLHMPHVFPTTYKDDGHLQNACT